MRRTSLRGHALRGEGKAHIRSDEEQWIRCHGHIGRGVCECGAGSDVEWTDAARKRWHVAHKDEVKQAERRKAIWAETSTVEASCLAHRRLVRWEPNPMWWYHPDLSTCVPLLKAPAPIPRDRPWRPRGYGYEALGYEVYGCQRAPEASR